MAGPGSSQHRRNCFPVLWMDSHQKLQRIGLYKNYDWDLVRKKQILPRYMINVESASGTIEQGSLADKSFAEFDW
ncbi:hypothetical protein quinque_014195 [Culex quinquefasciatus]